MKTTLLAALSLATMAHADESTCIEKTASFSSLYTTFSESYEAYDSQCSVALPASEDCYTISSDCATEAYKFNEAGSTYLYDPEAQQDCYKHLLHCDVYEDKNTADNEKCYTCYRWMLYYQMSVDGPPAEEVDLDRGCESTDNDRADCYEWFAADSCTSAAESCMSGWNAQCIEGRDALWQSWDSACRAYDDYSDACADEETRTSVLDACDREDLECQDFARTNMGACMCNTADESCVDYSPLPSIPTTTTSSIPPPPSLVAKFTASTENDEISLAAVSGGAIALCTAFAAGFFSKRA